MEDGATIAEDGTFIATAPGEYTVVLGAYYDDGSSTDDYTIITVIDNESQNTNSNTNSNNNANSNSSSNTNENNNSQNNNPTPHSDYDVERTKEKANRVEDFKMPEPTKEKAAKTSGDWMQEVVTENSDGSKTIQNFNKNGYTNTITEYDSYGNTIGIKRFGGTNAGVSGLEENRGLYHYQRFENNKIKEEIFYNQKSGEVTEHIIYENGIKKNVIKYVDNFGNIDVNETTYIIDTENNIPILNTLIKYSDDLKYIIYDENRTEGYKKQFSQNKAGEWVLNTLIEFKDDDLESYTKKIFNVDTGYLDELQSIIDQKKHGEYERHNSYIKDNVIVVTTLIIGGYNDGQMDGEWYYFYIDSGEVSRYENYIDGKKDGEYIEYYGNGNKKIETYFNNGSISGEYRSYFENGNIRELSTYKDGIRDGKYYIYYSSSNAKIQIDGQYSNGQMSGEWKTYDANGKLTDTKNY